MRSAAYGRCFLRSHNFCLQNAGIRRGLIDCRGERWAVHDVPVSVRTVVDGVLEEVDVPSVREVAVVPITGRVAVGENPGTRAPIIELVDGDEHLVKEGHEVDGVAVGAITVVEVLDGVRHVRLMVRAVEIYTIPALREEDLVTDSILALVHIGEIDVLALSIGRIVGDGTAVVWENC